MWRHGVSPRSMISIGSSAMAAAGVSLIFLLPGAVVTVLTVWTLASLPIGILIGHCVLNENEE
jgi:hypothetical protein